MDNALTPSQKQILEFIKKRLDTTGVSPSYREIQEEFGYKAVGTVQDHVKALLKKGHLERPSGTGPRRARGLIPAGSHLLREDVRRIPIYGEIAAGNTRDAAQIELGALFIAESAAKQPCFALRVVGDSMIDVGIFEGDHLIVERTNRVRNGDIVVALLNGETTVKRYFEENGRILLIPENRRLSPIPVTTEAFEIQGKVVGLQRKIN